MSEEEKKKFQPKAHMMRVQGGREYLPVSARLIWFREEHPDWGIVTNPIEINMNPDGNRPPYAIFSAQIFNAEGRLMATGTKMEDLRGFGEWLEKAECVPLTTRILTAEGWKAHDELRIGESVAAYDVATDSLNWVPLLAVRQYENAPVVRVRNGKGFNAVCTREHKWAVRRAPKPAEKRRGYRRLKETSYLTKADALIVAAPAPGGNLPVTPEQAFVAGLLITDGSLRYNGKNIRGYICQSKPAQVAIIRERLASLPHRESVVPAHTRTFPTGKTYDCRIGYRWEISATYLHQLHEAFGIEYETELPRVVSKLSTQARAAMMEAMMLAEGDARGNFAQMPGRNDWVIDLWTQLCALEGSMVCESVVRSDAGGIWVARRKKTPAVYASNLIIEDAGRCDVWCPQTPFGTWIARFDNDLVTITGNTGAIGRALAMCGYGTQFAPELEEGPRLADSPYPVGGGNRFAGNGRPAGSGPAGGGYNSRPLPPRPEPAPARPAERAYAEEPTEDDLPTEPPVRAAERPAPARPVPPPPRAREVPVAEDEERDLPPPPDDEDPFAEVDAPASARPAAPPARVAAARAAAVKNEAGEAVLTNDRCSVEGCPILLTPSQVTMSMTKFGQALCPRHQKDAAPLAGGAAPKRSAKPEMTEALL